MEDGSLVWYLGGDLAERGVERTDQEQLAAGRDELRQLFPWLDFSNAEFATLDVTRAEPRQQALVKPDNAYARRDQNLIIAWPTKLTLAPDLGDRVEALIREQGLDASEPLAPVPESLRRAEIGRPQWHRLFGEQR